MTSAAARITFVSLAMSQDGQSSDGLSPKTAVGDFLEAIENNIFVEDDDSLLLSLGVVFLFLSWLLTISYQTRICRVAYQTLCRVGVERADLVSCLD